MQTYRPMAAALWMVGSILSFTAMAIAGRSVAAVHDTFEVMLWRSVTGFVLVVLVAGLTGQLYAVQTRNLPQHVMRNVVHFTGQNLWFWALTAIPLAQVFALGDRKRPRGRRPLRLPSFSRRRALHPHE